MASIIKISILADAANAVRGLAQTGDAADKMGTKVTGAQKVGTGFKNALAPATAVLGGLGAAMFKSGQDAAELADSIDASKIILGGAQKQVESFADTAAKSFGLSKQATLDAANAFGTLGAGAGLTGDKLGAFTTTAIGRAGDMASMFGGTATEAVDAMGSALRGEFEPIRKYGVLLDQNTLQAQALKMGLIDNIKTALTPQQKTLAINAAILDQTSKAQGNFAQTAGSAKNKQEAFKASLANASAELGAALLPALAKGADLLSGLVGWIDKNRTAFAAIVGVIGTFAAAIVLVNVGMKAYAAGQAIVAAATKIWAAIQWVLDAAMAANPLGLIIIAIIALIAIVVLIATKTTWFQTIWKVAWGAIKAAAGAVWDFIKAIGAWFAGPFADFFVKGFNLVKNFIVSVVLWINGKVNAIIAFFTAIPGNLRDMGSKILGAISSGIQGVVNWINGKVRDIISFFTSIPGKVAGVGRDLVNGLVNGITSAWHWVTDKVQGLVNKIPKAIRDLLGIGSPSKVMADIGRNVTLGLAGGIVGQVGAVHDAMREISGAVSSGVDSAATVDIGLVGQRNAAATAGTINVTVNVPPVSDPAEVGRQVVRAIKAHQTQVGRTFLVGAA